MKINVYRFVVIKRHAGDDKIVEYKSVVYKASKHLRGAIRKLYATYDFDDIVSVREVV